MRKNLQLIELIPTLAVVVIVVFLVCFNNSNSVSCQTVLFPAQLHLDENNTLLLLSNANDLSSASAATLNLRLIGESSPFFSQQVLFAQAKEKKPLLASVSFLLNSSIIPSKFFNEKEKTVTVEVTFLNSITSSALVEVSSEMHGFLYLQTDKPIYRVTDTVRFRLLRLDRHLRPLAEKVTLRIANHQQIKVEEVKLETGTAPMYIAEHNFTFPLVAKPGTWTADVLYGPKHRQLITSTAFDVTEYVLPTFGIELTLPSFIFPTDTSVNITMNVRYPFGQKPVRGTVYFRCGITTTNVAKVEGRKELPPVKFLYSTSTFCFDRGVMSHQVELDWLQKQLFKEKYKNFSILRFVVETTVRECATHVQERVVDRHSVAIVEQPYSFSFKRTVRWYKPLVDNYFAFEIVDPHGKPTTGVPFRLTISSIEKTSVTLKHKIVFEKNGLIVFKVHPEDNQVTYIVDLKTTVKYFRDTQQTQDSFVLKYFNQTLSVMTIDKKPSLWIANKSAHYTFQVGDYFRSEILAKGLQGNTTHLIVISKGTVVKWKRIQLEKDSKGPEIDLLISNQMVPSARLLLVATSENGNELLADSHRLTVTTGPKCGGLEVQLQGSLKKRKQKKMVRSKEMTVLPGGVVNFEVAGGQQGDVLGFHAVDEGVRLLKKDVPKTDSLKSYSYALLERADRGCGPGGAAANSAQVFQAAGFKVLSARMDNADDGDISLSEDKECQKKKEKRKRILKREAGGDDKMKIATTLINSSSSSTLKEAFKQWCCRLGKLVKVKTTEPDSECINRSIIVQRYTTSMACASEFKECCELVNQGKNIEGSRTSDLSSLSSNTAAKQKTKIEEKEDDIDSGGVTINRVRSDFRDTWLFDLVLLNHSTSQTIPFTSPDSITNWAVHTLAITRRDGFCLPDDHSPIATVTTFKPFFLKVRLPSLIVEHEQAEVQVTVFNYQLENATLNVTFEKVEGLCSDWLHAPRATRELLVNSHSYAQTAFSLLPIRSGRFDIHIKAQAKGGAKSDFVDAVKRTLIVLAPGVEREHQLTFDLDPQNRTKRAARVDTGLYVDETTGSEQRTKVKLRSVMISKSNHLASNVDLNNNIVPGSVRYVVTALGDQYHPQLGSAGELSEQMIRKPKGSSGEENAFTAAFNLYSMEYLKHINRLTPKTRAKGISYLWRALLQMLEFRKNDGSFAIFQKRPASVWLTAFVAKTFCKAGQGYLTEQQLDKQVVQTAVKWLQLRQIKNYHSKKGNYPHNVGSFEEENLVLSKKEIDGVKKKNSPLPLTAYLLLTLRQCRPYLKQFNSNTKLDSLDQTIRLAEGFVLAHYRRQKEKEEEEALEEEKENQQFKAFHQALVAYSLSFSPDPEAAHLKEELTRKLASSSTRNSSLNQQFWADIFWPVETAAYALLAFITPSKLKPKPDLLQHMSIANWLNAQQVRGTWENTQDTIVALEALSTFYALYKKEKEREKIADNNNHYSENPDNPTLKIDVLFDHHLWRSLRFNKSNSDLLQTVPVDRRTREIEFKTTGNGLGKLSLLVIYNEFAPNSTSCHFFIEVDAYQYQEQAVVHENIIEKNYILESLNASLYSELQLTSNQNRRKLVESENTFYLNADLGADKDSQKTYSCCENTRLAKRRKRFSESDIRVKRTGHHFEPLPTLPTAVRPFSALVLSICVSYLTPDDEPDEYTSDINILEVGLLSGYRPVTQDLEAQIKQNAYLVHYEVTTTKILFYLGMIPGGAQACLQFRLYQQHRVANVQPALVRLYNYYENEWSCTRFYSQQRETNYIDYQCGSKDKKLHSNLSKNLQSNNEDIVKRKNSCQCVTRERCPGAESVDNARRADGGFGDMDRLFCAYTHIIIGTVGTKSSQVETGYLATPVLYIKVDQADASKRIISGNIKIPTIKTEIEKENTIIKLNFHAECLLLVQAYEPGMRVLVMHNPDQNSDLGTDFNQTLWAVDGNSVLKLLIEESNEYEEIKRYIAQINMDNCQN